MWQTKYASAVPKNLGVEVNFRPCSEGYFLSRHPQSVLLRITFESYKVQLRRSKHDGQKWISHNNFSCEKGFSADFVSRRDTCCMYGSVLHWSKKNCELTCGILTRLYLDFKQVFFNINYFFQIQIFHQVLMMCWFYTM